MGPYEVWEVGQNGAIKLATLDNNPIRDPVNGSKLKIYQERRGPTIGVNMLGYATQGDWTIEREEILEEDPVIKEQMYRPNEAWTDPITSPEERLVKKHMEGIVIPRIHKHLTNAYSGISSEGRKTNGGL